MPLSKTRPAVLMCFLALFCVLVTAVPSARAGERMTVTYLIASNQGQDFDLDNDAYRDELIKLFSYSSYKQVDQQAVELERSKRVKLDLPEGYELLLTLQAEESGRYMVQVVIMKDRVQYLDTVLSILKPGVLFVGGPPAQGGDLIIVLEMGF